MKIGILTFHRSINNGAVMQCYSLSKALQRRFPKAEVEVIDYHMPKVQKIYDSSLIEYLKSDSMLLFAKKFAKLCIHPTSISDRKRKNEVFVSALKKLPLSKDYIFDDSPEKLLQYINVNYDIVVVGSDAIWNYTMRGFPNAYFLCPELKCKKLSYAASCYGMDFLKEEKNKGRIKECLDAFDFIGVRDTATEDFVKWSGSTNTSTHTCDPTAFLDVDDLPIDDEKLKEKLKGKGFDFNRETIGIMGNDKMLRMIRSFYGKQYQIVSLFNYLKGADVQLYDLEPYEWAYMFKYFKLTFTTYFHGTMLSLRNGVPLICIALETEFAKKHTPKTLDLLQRLGLESWYFKTDYISTNTTVIKQKADELLSSKLHDDIVSKMNKEARTADAFFNELESIIIELQ